MTSKNKFFSNSPLSRNRFIRFIDKWWKGSPKIVENILSDKINLLDIYFFLTQKTTFWRFFPYSSEFKRVIEGKIQDISPFSALTEFEIRPFSTESSIEFLTKGFFSLNSFHHFSIKISSSPSLSEEKISSKRFIWFIGFRGCTNQDSSLNGCPKLFPRRTVAGLTRDSRPQPQTTKSIWMTCRDPSSFSFLVIFLFEF